jgi:hypothetical protein
MPEIKHFAIGADAHTIVNAIKEDGAIISTTSSARSSSPH